MVSELLRIIKFLLIVGDDKLTKQIIEIYPRFMQLVKSMPTKNFSRKDRKLDDR